MATTSSDARSVVDLREHPVMRWGAVFAGWTVAAGIAMVLYAFGLAVGFSAIDPRDAAAVARGISAGTVVWMILTWSASLWIGSMFASWFDGRNDTEMGVVRGLTVWGLSMVVTGLLVAGEFAHAGSVTAVDVATRAIDPALLARYITVSMWTAFGSAVAALLASAFGGWLGARHVHYVYHLRKYQAHGR
ncbi:MAG: hypothetical protein WAK94_17625 [Steroidobacteraceae bacterium]